MPQRQRAFRRGGAIEGRRPLIIDTDPGVDDAFAIALAARHPDAELLGVTAVHGNVPLGQTSANALRVLALTERSDVPVAAGAARPLVASQPHRAGSIHGPDGLGGRSTELPEHPVGLDRRPAVSLLADLLKSADEPVTIATIGPLSNLAALLAGHPDATGNIDRVVMMAGSLSGGNDSPAAEFNVWCDPEAARRVLSEEGLTRAMVPLDVTRQCRLDPGWLAALAGSSEFGASMVGVTHHYQAAHAKAYGERGMLVHDAVAVSEAITPGTLTPTPMLVDVECGQGPARGATIAEKRPAGLRAMTGDPFARPESPQPTEVMLGGDLDGLRARLLEVLSPG
jgi:pyrimidine-specific ribonucleoside hydrolase